MGNQQGWACPQGCPYEGIIMSNVSDMREDLRALREGQDTMKDKLHSAVLDNTTKLTELDARMAGMETAMHDFKKEVRKEARRWGAVGGAAASAAGVIIALAKSAFKIGS